MRPDNSTGNGDPVFWVPRFLDLLQCDFFSWGQHIPKVYFTPVDSIEIIKRLVLAHTRGISEETWNYERDSMYLCLNFMKNVEGGHISNLENSLELYVFLPSTE